jgi:hypothetical protein
MNLLWARMALSGADSGIKTAQVNISKLRTQLIGSGQLLETPDRLFFGSTHGHAYDLALVRSCSFLGLAVSRTLVGGVVVKFEI